MTRLKYTALACAAAAAGPAAGSADRIDVETGGCRVIRFTADGRRTETPPVPGVKRSKGGGSVSVGTSSRGRSSASASVSASSSSGGSGRSTASTSSYSDGVGRTITRTEDADGCTLVIDERPRRG